MVDFHAHILPECDHGSDSIETSLKQCEMALNAGVSTIFATPHFYMNKDTIEAFTKRRESSYNLLSSSLKDNNLDLRIIKSCEVNLQIDLFKIKDLKPLCIENSNYILIELPLYIPLTKWHYDAISEIQNMGFQPIIAHINRYSDFVVDQIFEKEVMCQINIEAFRHFSPRQRVKKWIKKDFVQFIGSDIHGLSESYNDLGEFARKYPKFERKIYENSIRFLNFIDK